MINAVDIINHAGETLRCVLGDPEFSGFSIDKIDGLGPGKLTVSSSEFARWDGGAVTNARMPLRNIVLYLTLYDYYGGRYQTIEQSRNRVYDLFPLKKDVTLIFDTDLHRYKISGFVESNEPDIFSSEETAQISILCPMPYFSLDDPDTGESGEIEAIIFYSEGLFEFPMDDPGTEEPEPSGLTNPVGSSTIMFGNRAPDNYDRWTTLEYSGNVDTGLIFRFKILSIGVVNHLMIRYFGDSESNDEISWLRFSNIGYGFNLQAEDELIISTVYNDTYAIIKRGARTINVFSHVYRGGDWLKLQKGHNVFKLEIGQVVGSQRTDIITTVEYKELFSGV